MDQSFSILYHHTHLPLCSRSISMILKKLKCEKQALWFGRSAALVGMEFFNRAEIASAVR